MDSGNVSNISEIGRDMLDREMLKLTLSLYNHPLLSRKAVNDVIDMFDTFVSQSFLTFIQNRVKMCKNEMNDSSYAKIQYILEDCKNMFGKFSSEHFRFQTYEQESLYIPPETFEIGKQPVVEIDNEQNEHTVMKPVFGVHIPLRKTFQTVLAIPGMFEQIQAYMNKVSNEKMRLSNFVQGDLWNKKYNNTDKVVVPFYCFFDEFESGNPLGSHAGEGKLGAVYVTFATLPPHVSAKMKNIFISSVFYAKHLKEFGNEKVFSKTIDDIKSLSTEGINLNINGQNIEVFFECVLTLGDNLGLNSILGFSESFNANYYCRICKASKSECSDLLEENDAVLRTVQSYNIDVAKQDFQHTGIREECIFHKIPNFHVAENITVDVMHDVFEGVAAYDLGNILTALIKDKVLTLQTINFRIDTFPYNEIEKGNKPRKLYFTSSQKGGQQIKIKQSAAELLCLTRYLGLMIGDLIPSNNRYWELYKELRNIVGIVTCHSLDRGQIMLFKEFVKKHHALYLECFGPLKPKMHLLTHYSRIMLLNGPVIHFSAMKFERKNKQLKEFTMGTTSNVNLPLTLAIRHNLELCYIHEFNKEIHGKIVNGPTNNVDGWNLLTKMINLKEKIPVTTLKYVTVNGIKYSPETILVTRFAEDPQFGKLITIFYFLQQVYFHVQEFDTICFNEHYHAYQVHSKISKPLFVNANLVPEKLPCLYITK